MASLSLESPLPAADDGLLDPRLVAELYTQHATELQWFLRGVLRDADAANDVLQNAFAKVVERGHTARKESLKGWLFRVAYNEAMVLKRRQATGEKVIRRIAWTQPQEEGSPDEHVVRWESVTRVREALADLPAEQQKIVRLRIYDQKTFAVIAKELGIPLGTALSRMRAGLAKLRQRLADDEET